MIIVMLYKKKMKITFAELQRENLLNASLF